MYKVSIKTSFEAAHRLHLHSGECSNIHGHSYKMQWVFEGRRNNTGMVADFKTLKWLCSKITDTFDHALLLSTEDPLLPTFVPCCRMFSLRYVECSEIPTAEGLALMALKMFKETRKKYDIFKEVSLVLIKVFETKGTCACLKITKEMLEDDPTAK